MTPTRPPTASGAPVRAVLGRLSCGTTSSYSIWKIWTYDADGRVTDEATVSQGAGLLFQSSRMVHDAEEILRRSGFAAERLARVHDAYVLEWRLRAAAPATPDAPSGAGAEAGGAPVTSGAAGQTCPPRLLSAV